MRAIAALAAALCLVVTAASGCGGGSSAGDYTKRVNEVQHKFAAQIGKVSADTGGAATAAQAAAGFDSLAKTLESSAGELAAIKPPDKVAAEHNRMVAAIRGFAGQVKRTAAVLRGGKQSALIHAQAQFITSSSEASTAVNKAIDAINSKLGAG